MSEIVDSTASTRLSSSLTTLCSFFLIEAVLEGFLEDFEDSLTSEHLFTDRTVLLSN